MWISYPRMMDALAGNRETYYSHRHCRSNFVFECAIFLFIFIGRPTFALPVFRVEPKQNIKKK